MSNYKLILLLLIFTYFNVKASETDSILSIVDIIENKSNCNIFQPESLKYRLKSSIDDSINSETKTEEKQGGYRIQIYSGNGLRSKTEAISRENIVKEKYPQYPYYIVYNAPFWRVKVGDFKIKQDAEDFIIELKKEFPSFKREISIVRDRINTKNQ